MKEVKRKRMLKTIYHMLTSLVSLKQGETEKSKKYREIVNNHGENFQYNLR